MDNIKVSIIIPVYNVEKYLKECLDSIVNQTLKEIEIICVNDGSTDKSPQILEEYAQKDKRIKIINKKNEGLGAARKTGLEHVNGNFIAFVDSDDWVELNTFEKLYNNAISNNSDIVMFNSIRYDEYKNEFTRDRYNIAEYFNENIDFNNFVFDYTTIKPHLLNKTFAAWAKIYKTEFLRSYDDFYFPKYLSFEDVPFHVQILLRASRISFCKDRLYIYRISNIHSISNSSSKSKKVFDIFRIVNEVEKTLIESKKMDEFKYEFFTFKIVQLTQWFDKCNKNFKQEFFELIKENFKNIKLSIDEINELDYNARNKYQNIINSDSYREFELLKKICVLESTHNELNRRKQVNEEKIRIQKQIIQEITSSNSWKLTEPLRNVGKYVKNFKKKI